MKNSKWTVAGRLFLLSTVGLLLLSLTLRVKAQQLTVQQFAGTYTGGAKTPAQDLSLTLELKYEDGKLSGRFLELRKEHEEQKYKVLSGEIKENKLVIYLSGPSGGERLMLQQADGGLIGKWARNGDRTPALVDLHKIVADEISGEWDATADAQGQAFPFTLALKADGEKVTGTSDSQLGHSTISKGVWKDGRLALVLDSANGPVGLVATLSEGKLVGDYDFAGQLQGKWVAIRKK